MTSLYQTEGFYLGRPPDQTFAVLHPARDPARGTAVLICPPFGWEEVTSYRIRRGWAGHLARRGFATLRLSLPSTGDSGGMPRDPGRVDAWTAAIHDGASYLRASTGAAHVVALGLGLGGLLAYRAACFHDCLDGIILWSTPAQGAEFIRQTRAFSRMERSMFWGDMEPRSALADGEMEAGGFVLASETLEALRQLDVADLPLGRPLILGALLLDRDGVAVDERLTAALTRDDVQFSIAAGEGYAAMTSHPQTAEMPEAVVETVDAWLEGQADSPAQGRRPSSECTDEAVLMSAQLSDPDLSEAPLTLEVNGLELRGILTRPAVAAPGPAVVMLNAGGQRRTGPNRMWVEAARRWAHSGVTTLRVDVEGIGESDGELMPYRLNGALHSQYLVDQVQAVVDELRARSLADEVVLVGLCAGAYWAFHQTIDNDHVRGAVILNANTLVWQEELAAARDLRRLFTDHSWALIRKNATRARVAALVRWLIRTPARLRQMWRERAAGSLSPRQRTDLLLEQLRDSGKPVTFVFSGREPLIDELERTGWLARMQQWPRVTIERVAVNDHTLRPSWAQQQVHQILDGALHRISAQSRGERTHRSSLPASSGARTVSSRR